MYKFIIAFNSNGHQKDESGNFYKGGKGGLPVYIENLLTLLNKYKHRKNKEIYYSKKGIFNIACKPGICFAILASFDDIISLLVE